MHVLSLPQNKFGLVFFRLFDGALETSNFRFEEARSAITLLRCFLHENTQRGKIARVKFAEELGTMSKNRLRWITLVRGPIWGIHSLTLMISWGRLKRDFAVYGPFRRNGACLVIRIKFKDSRDKSTDVGLRVRYGSVIVLLCEGIFSVSHAMSSIKSR